MIGCAEREKKNHSDLFAVEQKQKRKKPLWENKAKIVELQQTSIAFSVKYHGKQQQKTNLN